MIFEKIDWYRRASIAADRGNLYVFGDNMMRRGFGGQAYEARGESNAVGIPTKKAPSWEKTAFFSDADFDQWIAAASADFDRIACHDGKVFWPAAGIGTERADLKNRAPSILAAIEAIRDHFFSVSGKDMTPAEAKSAWRAALAAARPSQTPLDNQVRPSSCLAKI